MTARDALQWLYGTQLFGIKLGLDNMRRLCAALGVPASGQKFIHVAGTNGKGSVCAFAASICRAAGLRTGLFTSPHLIRFNERLQIDGVPIGDRQLAAGLTRLRRIAGNWPQHPTFFELTAALALDWFARQGTDVIVWETGMGGRLDATNIVTPLVSVITPVAMDHEQWLGSSLRQIAAEKAGIIKPGVPVVSAPQAAEAADVLRQTARKLSAPMRFVTEKWTRGRVSLAGTHQKWNAAVAVAAVQASGLPVAPSAVRKGLASAHWPARFQRVGRRLVIDGAHNPDGAEKLRRTWREIFGRERAAVVYGAVAGKDVRGGLRHLAKIAAAIFPVRVNSPRAVGVEEIALLCRESAPDAGVTPCPDLRQALKLARASGHPVLVAGSLYLCGETLALLESRADFESSWQ